MDTLLQDLRYAARTLRKAPAFASAAVLTIALGIGATTSIFSVVHTVLLRPLPYADSDRMVLISETLNGNIGPASAGHYHDWAEQSRSFSAVAALEVQQYNLTDEEPVRVNAARVTPTYFQVAYMPPALGRYFHPSETADSRVVVLSHALWQTQFGGDSAIVGRGITLSGAAHSVIGVAPALTLTEFDVRLWTPLSFTPERRANYGSHFLTVMGRLKPGVSLEQARRDIAAITEDIRSRQPGAMKNRGVVTRSFGAVLVSNVRTQLWVLLGAVILILLIGCGNVASLLLARAAARRKEIALRGALGAARTRLVRQLITESLLLAFAGGGAGVVLAVFGIRFLVSMGPPVVPRLAEAGLDPAVLGFALMVTIACGLLFGLAPALRATRGDLQAELREGGRGAGGAIRDRVRAALIVTEIAVALVLLVSAGLLIRSAERLQHVRLGFDPAGVTTMRVTLPPDRYNEAPAVEAAFTRIVEQVRSIPGVQSAAASTRVPMGFLSINMSITVDGGAPNPDRDELSYVQPVTDGYFETLGMTLKRGRLLGQSDLRAGAPWVTVVNETFARQIFGDESPLGKRVSGWTSGPQPEWREIVGVVEDVRTFGLENDVPPEMYVPMTQAPGGAWNAFLRSMSIVARSRPGTPVAHAMRNAIKSVDAMLPPWGLPTMDDVLQRSTATRRFHTLLLSFLGLTGLVLAAIGVYGVIAFFVSQRTHEIGVRIALGATAREVVRMVFAQSFTLAVIGVAIGGAAAYWSTQALRTMLFQVGARDPIAYVAAAVVLILVAVIASTLPARRATRIDPMVALRTE